MVSFCSACCCFLSPHSEKIPKKKLISIQTTNSLPRRCLSRLFLWAQIMLNNPDNWNWNILNAHVQQMWFMQSVFESISISISAQLNKQRNWRYQKRAVFQFSNRKVIIFLQITCYCSSSEFFKITLPFFLFNLKSVFNQQEFNKYLRILLFRHCFLFNSHLFCVLFSTFFDHSEDSFDVS